MTGFVADGDAAFIFGERVAVRGGAALWRAHPVTANSGAGGIARLRAGVVEPSGERHTPNHTAKQRLERRSPRAPSRQRARQRVESLIVHWSLALSQKQRHSQARTTHYPRTGAWMVRNS
jgi:hypothetical protein